MFIYLYVIMRTEEPLRFTWQHWLTNKRFQHNLFELPSRTKADVEGKNLKNS